MLSPWHELVRSRNAKGLNSLLADNVVFHSPVVHTPQVRKPITVQYLSAAFHVFFNESFKYVREIAGTRDAVLETAIGRTGTVKELEARSQEQPMGAGRW